jgi:hypothetical protein
LLFLIIVACAPGFSLFASPLSSLPLEADSRRFSDPATAAGKPSMSAGGSEPAGLTDTQKQVNKRTEEIFQETA